MESSHVVVSSLQSDDTIFCFFLKEWLVVHAALSNVALLLATSSRVVSICPWLIWAHEITRRSCADSLLLCWAAYTLFPVLFGLWVEIDVHFQVSWVFWFCFSVSLQAWRFCRYYNCPPAIVSLPIFSVSDVGFETMSSLVLFTSICKPHCFLLLHEFRNVGRASSTSPSVSIPLVSMIALSARLSASRSKIVTCQRNLWNSHNLPCHTGMNWHESRVFLASRRRIA